MNKHIDFNDWDIDEGDIDIPDKFIGHENIYNFLIENNIYDKWLYNFEKYNFEKYNFNNRLLVAPYNRNIGILHLTRFLNEHPNRWLLMSFSWDNTKEGKTYWENLHKKWNYENCDRF